jgi:1-acyl-sn-glycerol-3-phosphate acyltransferase
MTRATVDTGVPYRIAKRILRPLTRWLFRVRVDGEENVPEAGGLVVACNHVSYLDPPLLGTWFPRTIHFMAKRELFAGPAGALLRALHAFPVDRERADVAAFRHALRIVKAGGVVGIFPEGRRNLDGEAQARQGAVLLAATAGCPLLPVGLAGTRSAARRLRRGEVAIRIGRPLHFQGSPRRPTKAELQDWTDRLSARIAELREGNGNTQGADPRFLLRR